MSEIGAHVGEDAELYALGQLDDVERVRMERHVAHCVDCERRVGDAEAAVLRLIEAQPAGEDASPLRPLALERPKTRAYAPWLGAIAAAFVLGLLLPWGFATLRERAGTQTVAPQQLADAAMLNGHFLHTPFVPLAAAAPPAKVIYARHGGWFYVLVGPGTSPLDVVIISGKTRSAVATIPPSSQARAVFVPAAQLADSIVLLDGGRPVASARIVYAR